MSTTGSRPSLPPALQLVGRLAVEHAAHLKWLQRRIAGGQAAVLEDALQTAYAEALRQLRDPGRRQPEFDSFDAARRWLRTIAANAARRTLRRAVEIPMTGEDGWPDATTASADSDVLERHEWEHAHDGLQRALAGLSEEHARFLRWRYVENLPPATIMALEGFGTLGQYDGRHRRALEALRNALVRLQPDAGCARARVLLLREPEAVLGGGRAAVHIVGCLPCQAYQRRLRGALALAPLSPAAVFALRDAVRQGPAPSGGDAGDAPPAGDGASAAADPSAGGAAGNGSGLPAGVAKAIAVLAVAVAAATAAGSGGGSGSGSAKSPGGVARRAEQRLPPREASPPARATLRWAEQPRRLPAGDVR